MAKINLTAVHQTNSMYSNLMDFLRTGKQIFIFASSDI